MRTGLLLIAACVSVLLLAAPPLAAAGTRRATDSQARVRFTLDGRLLTVRVLSRAPRRVRQRLLGERVRAVCGTRFPFTRGVTVRRTRFWPAGRRRMRYRFSRDTSRRAKWCLLEHARGADAAFVTFPS